MVGVRIEELRVETGTSDITESSGRVTVKAIAGQWP